jgi:hypothetical protein
LCRTKSTQGTATCRSAPDSRRTTTIKDTVR